MTAPDRGLARVTIRTPQRRLDLAIPGQVPIAELLPEVLYRAGEAAPLAGGWLLRRGDGDRLTGERGLADQGVRDGEVLYLVPRELTWPEPHYDDIIEEIAEAARAHGRGWDAAATRLAALVAAALVVLTAAGVLAALGSGATAAIAGLLAVVAALGLVGTGAMLSRAVGDGVAGATAAGLALPFAALAGWLAVGPGVATRILVAAAALLLAAVGARVAVGANQRVFVAGIAGAVLVLPGAIVGLWAGTVGAAAVTLVLAVGGIALAPAMAVRLGRLPRPMVSAVPEVIAAESRPPRSRLAGLVGQAEEVLTGILLGAAIAATGAVAVLTLGPDRGVARSLLALLAGSALLLRARVFPTVAARVPLLGAGLVSLLLTTVTLGGAVRLPAVLLALVALVALLATAVTAPRRVDGVSPYLGRLADIGDLVTVVALAPVALQVLHAYSAVRHLLS